MDCSTPITPDPGASFAPGQVLPGSPFDSGHPLSGSPFNSGHPLPGSPVASGLATTGSPFDIALLCAIAGALLVAGLLFVLSARSRKARTGRGSTAGRNIFVATALGALFILSGLIPSQAAHADAADSCPVLQVSDVTISETPSTSGSIQLLPGNDPVTVRARVTNGSAFTVALTVASRTDESAPIAHQISWTAQRDSLSASGSLTGQKSFALGTLPAGATTELLISLSLPASLGNDYQGQSVPVTLLLTATQQDS